MQKIQSAVVYDFGRLSQIGWRTYNSLKKKAVASSSNFNFVLSLAIAFFIVFVAVQILSWVYGAVEGGRFSSEADRQRIIYFMQKS